MWRPGLQCGLALDGGRPRLVSYPTWPRPLVSVADTSETDDAGGDDGGGGSTVVVLGRSAVGKQFVPSMCS